MDTNMTFGQKLPLPSISTSYASKVILGDIKNGKGGIKYLPNWWILGFFNIKFITLVYLQKT